jgi:hypothetical protein
MSKVSRIGLRLLGVLTLAAVIHPWLPSLASGSAGRDYSRCIQACNETRRACEDRCTPECTQLFPNDKSARQACVSACKATCGDESSDCKLICQAIKNGDNSPNEP